MTIEFFKKLQTGIPGITSVNDNRYVMFNFGDINQHLDKFEIIKKISPGATIILNAYNDPHSSEYVLQRITSTGLIGHCFAFVSDQEFALNNRHSGIRFFPFAWHWLHSYHEQLPVAGDPPQWCNVDWQSRKYKLSCLNRRPSYSRFRTYYELQKQSWFNDVYVSFGGISLNNNLMHDPYRWLEPDARQWFAEHEHKFPFSSQQDYVWSNDWEFSVPAYANTYANLVTETFGESVFMTEKTVKPLAAGNIVFTAAQKNFLTLLRNLKFEIDYNGIDNSYDVLPTWIERIRAVVKEIDRVYADIPEIWHANKPQLLYNQQWLFSDDFKTLMLSDVKDIFEHDHSECGESFRV